MTTKLVVGLGNIGPKYTNTRHNVGFMIVDNLAHQYGAAFKLEPKLKAAVAKIILDDITIYLAKPQTMMNLSGEAVQRLIQHYRMQADDVWLVHDDIDLAVGEIRIKQGGSAGGQLGVKSTADNIGPNFFRLRFGIGRNDRASEPSEVYVMRPFGDDLDLPTAIASANEQLLTQLQPESE